MKSKFSDTEILIKRLKKGDNQAYIFLIKKYHRLLATYAFSLTKDKMLADDIVQNTFVKTWELRRKLKADKSLKSFLLTITYTEFINQYRKNKSVTALEEQYVKAVNEFVEESDNEHFDAVIELVKSAIEELPPKCKEIFIASKKEGLTNNEIASYYNISIKTVEGQMTKALSILRKKLKEKKQVLFLILSKCFWKK